jgi:hypothetical protein
MISSDDCRTRAVECYQAAQNATDYDARQALLGLAVQYCELASRMDSMNSDDKSASASGDELPPRLHTLLKKLDQELPEQKDGAVGQRPRQTRTSALKRYPARYPEPAFWSLSW